MEKRGQVDHGITAHTPRIAVIDAIRGFAIAAIFLIHTSNHFLLNEFPIEQNHCIAMLDAGLKELLYFLFEGKSYIIFALLFGFTFALQADRYSKKRTDFAKLMFWRMLLLIGFGILNAMFFAGGDPLVFYALSMLLVIPFRNIQTKHMMLLTSILLLQPMDVIHHFIPLWSDSYIIEYGKLSEVLKSGDMIETFYSNITTGLKACLLWALQTGRFGQTIGLFFLGILCYRFNLFAENQRWSRYYALWGGITVVLYLVKQNVASFVVMYYNLFFAITMVALFIQLFNRYNHFRYFKLMAIYGRMSLTNFIAQSILGALLFYPWAFNLAPSLGVSVSLLITLCLILVQIAWSRYWLQRNKKGPLESLWHRLTYLPFKAK
jgi:uncharacterized protein